MAYRLSPNVFQVNIGHDILSIHPVLFQTAFNKYDSKMHHKIVLLTFLSVLLGLALSFPHVDTYIFGGKKAAKNQFPFLVSLQVKIKGKYEHNCGASILSDRFLLTAGHCRLLGSFANDYQIAVGLHMKNDTGVRYNISKFILHPGHISIPATRMKHDIALLVLEKPLKLDKNTKTIQINPNVIGVDVKATLAGWGSSLDHYEGLKYIELTTISNQKCSRQLPRGLVKDEMVCAYSGRFGEGVCLGDSGGPLILDNKIIGISSWAKICAIGYPDGFTRVSSYIKWIEKVMKEESEQILSNKK